MKINLKTVAIIVFSILFVRITAAQSPEIDSLDNLIDNAVDTTRINLLRQKAFVMSNFNLDSTILIYEQAFEEANKINYYKGKLELLKSLTKNYAIKGDFESAEEYLVILKELVQPAKDSIDIAEMYGSYGNVYCIQGRYDEAIPLLIKAVDLIEKHGYSSFLATYYTELGIAYQQKSNYPQSIFYQQAALKLAEKQKNKRRQAIILVNLAGSFIGMGDTLRSVQTYKQAIVIAKKNNFKRVEVYAYSNLASIEILKKEWENAYEFGMKATNLSASMGDHAIEAASLSKSALAAAHMSRFSEATKLAQKAIEKSNIAGLKFNISQAYASMGTTLRLQKKFKEAIPYYKKAIAEVNIKDFNEFTGSLYEGLSECYEKTGSATKALKAYRNYELIKDSTRNRLNIQKATELTMNYEFEKKEQSTKDKQAAKDEITQTRQGALIIGLVLSIIIILGALIAFYNKKKANALLRKQKKEIESTLTKLKTTQTQLIQSEKMASLGELTAGIAHEIQNPLNFVNNFSELSEEMLEELAEEIQNNSDEIVTEIITDLKQNLNKITNHGKRASNIVKGMLEHSRTSSGVKELTNVNALADEFLRLSYHGLRAKDKTFNASFKTDFDTNLPKIEVVAQDLGRVILNLINNAFYAVSERAKASQPTKGGAKYEPKVTVSTKAYKSPSGNLGAGDLGVEIRVKDNGSGIPKDIKEKIFQPFFTTKPTGEGTGLGLSMSYDIITKGHGGELKVETKEGEGATFIIILPVKVTN